MVFAACYLTHFENEVTDICDVFLVLYGNSYKFCWDMYTVKMQHQVSLEVKIYNLTFVENAIKQLDISRRPCKKWHIIEWRVDTFWKWFIFTFNMVGKVCNVYLAGLSLLYKVQFAIIWMKSLKVYLTFVLCLNESPHSFMEGKFALELFWAVQVRSRQGMSFIWHLWNYCIFTSLNQELKRQKGFVNRNRQPFICKLCGFYKSEQMTLDIYATIHFTP